MARRWVGTQAQTLSGEISYEIIKNLEIAGFVDAGSLNTDKGSVLPKVTDVRYAAGLGLRYRLPFGPLRVDYGVNLDRRAGESVGSAPRGGSDSPSEADQSRDSMSQSAKPRMVARVRRVLTIVSTPAVPYASATVETQRGIMRRGQLAGLVLRGALNVWQAPGEIADSADRAQNEPPAEEDTTDLMSPSHARDEQDREQIPSGCREREDEDLVEQ